MHAQLLGMANLNQLVLRTGKELIFITYSVANPLSNP
jgi:hypothetical protein